MKKLFWFIGLIYFKMLSAQQGQQYSQYLINPFTINPAVSSTEDYMDVQMGYRKQWLALEGSPNTAYISAFRTFGKPFYHMHYKNEHKNWHGAGLLAFDDKIGPLTRNYMLLGYSFNIGITKKIRLSMGSFIGGKQIKTNANYWENIDDNTDVLFTENLNSGLKPELQVGAVMYSEDFFASCAIHNLVGIKIGFDSETDASTYSVFNRQAFLSAGYHFIGKENFKVTPSVMLKYIPKTPLALDLNVKVDYKTKYWAGMTTRVQESVNIFAGLRVISLLDISYAFEWSYSQLRKYNKGTHEIILGLRFKHPDTVVEPSKYW